MQAAGKQAGEQAVGVRYSLVRAGEQAVGGQILTGTCFV
jgi:hypothetical protein